MMARKEPDNFYRRQQEEANRIAVKQHRALVDLVKLTKSSNEELRKMRRAFEAFAEAVGGMKVEPFQVKAFTAARAEAERTAKIAEGEHPPPLFDAAAFKEMLDRSEAPVVPEGEPYPEVKVEPDYSKKRAVTRASGEGRAPRLGFGDVIEPDVQEEPAPIEVTVPVEVAQDNDGFTVNLNAEGELTNELPLTPATDAPVKLGDKVVGTADIFEDGTANVHFTDLAEIPRRQGYAVGGYTGVSAGPFAEPQLAGTVHPAELWGTAEQLQRMRDLGLIAEGTITHETDAQLDMGK